MPANNYKFKSINLPPSIKIHASDPITQNDLPSGDSGSVAITPALPFGIIPIGGYLVTTLNTTSSSANTNGLNASLGVAASTTGYILLSNIFGAAGRKTPVISLISGSPELLGTIRLNTAGTANIEFTALGGGSEDLDDINQLSIRAIIFYIPVPRSLP